MRDSKLPRKTVLFPLPSVGGVISPLPRAQGDLQARGCDLLSVLGRRVSRTAPRTLVLSRGSAWIPPQPPASWPRGLACTLSGLPAPPTHGAVERGCQAACVLTQHPRESPSRSPWQLAQQHPGEGVPGTGWRPPPGLRGPSGRARVGRGRGSHSPTSRLPSSAASSCSQRGVWKLCSRGPRAVVPGAIVGAGPSETCTREKTQDTPRGGDSGSEPFLEGGGGAVTEVPSDPGS